MHSIQLKNCIYSIVFTVTMIFIFIPALSSIAAGPDVDAGGGTGGSLISIPNPLGKCDGTSNVACDPRLLLGRIISAILGIVGSVALVLFIYGGVLWMTSAGNQERVKKGKEVIIWAVLGLGIIFTSYAVVKFIITAFVGTGTK